MQTLNRLPAEKLGVRETTLTILLGVRDDLESGRLTHVVIPDVTEDLSTVMKAVADVGRAFFNMGYWRLDGTNGCGTAMCLGGTMQDRGWRAASGEESRAIDPLFMPWSTWHTEWPKLTPQQTVRAIDHWTAGAGVKAWDRALDDIPMTAVPA